MRCQWMEAWCRGIEAAPTDHLRMAMEERGEHAVLTHVQRLILGLRLRATEGGKVDPLLWLAYTHFRRVACYGACEKCSAGLVPEGYSARLVCPLCDPGRAPAGDVVVMTDIGESEAERFIAAHAQAPVALVGVSPWRRVGGRIEVYSDGTDLQCLAGLSFGIAVVASLYADRALPFLIPRIAKPPYTILVVK